MSMSRKDYAAIAGEFRVMVDQTQDEAQLLKLSTLAKALSDRFFEGNARFSSARFLEACGFDNYGDPETPSREEYIAEHGNWVTSKAAIRITGKDGEVSPGDTVIDHRGQHWILAQATRFSCSELGKTGKVVVVDEFDRRREFYDSVFDLHVELMN